MDKLKAYLNVKTIRNPQWLDNDSFVYNYNKSGVPQVWMSELSTSKTSQLSDYQDFITGIVTNSVKGQYAFTMADGGNEQGQIFVGTKDSAPINITNDPSTTHQLGLFVSNSDLFLFSSNQRNKEHFDLETINLVTKKRSVVLENNDNYNFVDSVSPDGVYYVYKKLISQSNQPLYIFNTLTKETYNINEEIAQYGSSTWIDNDTFFYLSNVDSEFIYLCKYTVSTKEHEIVYQPNWDIETISVNEQGSKLALVLNEDGILKLSVYDVNTFENLNLNTPDVGVSTFYDDVVFSPDGNRLLFSHSSGALVSNIYLLDIETNTLTCVTENTLDFGQADLVEPSLHRYESFDGLSVPYWLYVPKGKDVKDLPVMIEIHGGPEAQQKSNFDELIAYIVSEGIAVVAPNVRGSTGYGKTYTHLDDVEKRLDSVKDIESLVDHLVSTKLADKDKIAVSGTSYGGFMTLSCAARYPDLFCAAVDTVGMYNLVTFLERTADYRRPHRESEYGSLAKHRDILFEVSPVAKVDDITGPLMIIHGTNDPRVPVYEAQQVNDYLSNKGVEVKFLEYSDEGHGIHKIKNKMDAYPKVIAFLKEKMHI